MNLWESGDRVVYTGEVWRDRYGHPATVLWSQNGQTLLRFDGEEKPQSCMELSLEREHNWKNKFWRDLYEGIMD